MTKKHFPLATVGRSLLYAIAGITLLPRLSAQFTPGILANDSYWSGGKAEFDIYEAQLMRQGELRKCEVLHIIFRERLDPKTLAQARDPKASGADWAIRMNQIWSAPIGMFAEQASFVGYWWPDSASLARLIFVGTDSVGNVMQKIELKGGSLNYAAETYQDGAATNAISPPANAAFYDELPLRVRTINWSKPEGEFSVPLAPTLTGFKIETIKFTPATVSWTTAEKTFEIRVKHAAGNDRFLVDRDFPYLLREWEMADGSRLRLKRSLKADYWNYGKEGDRERALKNPMLQHPD